MMCCNQEGKCKRMREAALRALTENLKEARKIENIRQCVLIMKDVEKELSEYDCSPAEMLKKRISSYEQRKKSMYQQQKLNLIDTLIAELEAFLLEDIIEV